MTDGYRGSTAGECEHSFADRLGNSIPQGSWIAFFVYFFVFRRIL